uniref:Uncharacterized protein n=1 Tax=Sipha flava TaxID=143950 RepID=A0A2S2QPV9_9HEMI
MVVVHARSVVAGQLLLLLRSQDPRQRPTACQSYGRRRKSEDDGGGEGAKWLWRACVGGARCRGHFLRRPAVQNGHGAQCGHMAGADGVTVRVPLIYAQEHQTPCSGSLGRVFIRHENKT